MKRWYLDWIDDMLSTTEMKIGQPYLVKWHDATFAWDNPDNQIGSPCQCMGWLMAHDEAGIRLAFEVGETLEDGARFFMDIPAGMIVEMEEL